MLYWAKTRPVVKELWQAIRNGATRNLYVANVPESLNDVHLLFTFIARRCLRLIVAFTITLVSRRITALFAPFGELESVRVGPKKGAAFVNYTSIAAAIKAKDNVNRQVSAPTGAESATKLLINFTSAQQNCMRARGGRPAGASSGQRGFRGYNDTRSYEGRSRLHSSRPTERRADAEAASLGRSRALYMGSVPDSVELEELAALVESFGVIDSMRLVRPKSCAFINFADETVARALQAKFTENEEASPEINGKKLTINFAKARPRISEESEQILQGARRKLRVETPTYVEDLPCVDAETAPAPPLSPPAEEGADAAPVARPAATHKLLLSFSSVAVAISVKAALEALTGELTVSGIDYIVDPVASEEEIAALLPSEGAFRKLSLSPVICLILSEPFPQNQLPMSRRPMRQPRKPMLHLQKRLMKTSQMARDGIAVSLRQ
ncbi:MAG: hypothetical protein SGPRY_013285 [Prymnesium sp.]